MADTVLIRFAIGDDGPIQEVRGRLAWALGALLDSGGRGVTPIERPAPRWSDYIDRLRDRFNLDILTVEERHGGTFRGWHGRYVLRSIVRVIERVTQ